VISPAAKLTEVNALPFIKWAKSEGCMIRSDAYEAAAKAGSFNLTKWMVKSGGWDEMVVAGAALGNS
jgi:hypothetical protein